MIYIPFPKSSTIGGPATFMQNLHAYLDRNNLSYATTIHHSSGIFFPIQYNTGVLDIYRKQGGAIIQRLDGIYYPSKHGADYHNVNAPIRKIYRDYATHIVFQSEYSKRQCFEMLGKRPDGSWSLIYNGVDTDIFYPGNRPFVKDEVGFVTTGNFRNADMLEPVVQALDQLRSGYSFRLVVAGPVADNLLHLLQRDYIEHKTSLDLRGIADVLRSSDIFIYSHLNPPCPNSVLEAIATGLPVVGFDSGAMKELCFFSTELLAPVSDDLFQVYHDFNPGALAEKITMVLENCDEMKKRAMQNTKAFAFEQCGERYQNIFKQEASRLGATIYYPGWLRRFSQIKNKLIRSYGN